MKVLAWNILADEFVEEKYYWDILENSYQIIVETVMSASTPQIILTLPDSLKWLFPLSLV